MTYSFTPNSIVGRIASWRSRLSDVDAFVRRRGAVPDDLPYDEHELVDPLSKIVRSRALLLWLHGEEDAAIVSPRASAA
ncbi:MAG: hypothetical protein ACHREM_31375 [Polyangiales bacterium]